MDPLTELFASKPTSYLGVGIIYNGDTRGNGVSSTEQDVVIIPRFNQSDASSSHPFKAPAQASSSSEIQPGSVNGNLVTGSPVNIGTSGTVQLYIRVTITLTISANGYVADEFATETAWIYQTGGSVPALTSGYFYIPVATYVDGVKTVQHLTTNISLRPRDDGTGTSTPTAFYWRS